MKSNGGSLIPETFNIGPVRISPATVLAPMAGVTDTVFRRLIRAQGGCGLLMTEFTSSHGVVGTDGGRRDSRNAQRFKYLSFEPLDLSPNGGVRRHRLLFLPRRAQRRQTTHANP